MPTLLKQGNYYYSQFYNSDKKPQRKRIALKTTYKSVALQLHRKDVGEQIGKVTH